MPINTAEKRRAVAGNGRPWRPRSVTPNEDKDAEWRRQAGFTYSGEVSGVVVAEVAPLAPSQDLTAHQLAPWYPMVIIIQVGAVIPLGMGMDYALTLVAPMEHSYTMGVGMVVAPLIGYPVGLEMWCGGGMTAQPKMLSPQEWRDDALALALLGLDKPLG